METLKAIGVAAIISALLVGVMLVHSEVPDTPVCMGSQPGNVPHGSTVVWTDCGQNPAGNWDPITRQIRR
jgi:collagenase-like PrtC family protease